MSPEFCLRWNNHQPNLVSVFKELLQSGLLVDVTLSAGGEFIHAHRLVLSACSLYFKELFALHPCQHPVIILKDFHIDDLKTVVDFIYQGEVNVAQERLPHVLKTAETLRIKGLAENPRSFEEFQTSSGQGGPRLGSQLSGGSSMSDSREQGIEVCDESAGDSVTFNTPPHKRRRTNYDTDEGKRSGIKEEPANSTTNSENRHSEDESGQTCRIRESSTLLHSLSPSGGVEGGDSNNPSPPHSGNSPTPPPSLPPTPSLNNNGDAEGGGAVVGLLPHGQGLDIRSSYIGEASTSSSTLRKKRLDDIFNVADYEDEYEKKFLGDLLRETGHIFMEPECQLKPASPTENVHKLPSPHKYRPNLPHPPRDQVLTLESVLICLTPFPTFQAADGTKVKLVQGCPSDFISAINDLREGKMGYNKAGKSYNINHMTLRKFYLGMGYGPPNPKVKSGRRIRASTDIVDSTR